MYNQTVKMYNETFKVFSLYKCKNLYEQFDVNKQSSLWHQHVIACYLLKMLKDMYQFNITYVIPEDMSVKTFKLSNSNSLLNTSIDIYAFPMTLIDQELLNVAPIIQVLMWRFGFLMRKVETEVLRRYYSDPFTRPLWNALYGMVILVSLIFFVQGWWDRKIFGGNWECSVGYELLIAIGAHCHISLPTEARLSSRRFSYVVFFLFALIIHSYFTSQLLSHLVVKEKQDFGLNELMNTDIEFLVLEELKWILSGVIPYNHNLSIVKSRLVKAKEVNISMGLQAIMSGNTALLTDYVNLYSVMKQMFKPDSLCKLIEVDIFTNVQKYFFTSKNFRYIEEFKIGALRVKEAGVLDRFLSKQNFYDCPEKNIADTKFTHIFFPFITLICTCISSVLIMFGERWWCKRNKVWPFTP